MLSICFGGLNRLIVNDAIAADGAPAIPRFSIENMDRSVNPSVDFYHFAAGAWLKKNPVPADKSRWSGFEELSERNWKLIRNILEATAADTSAAPKTPTREVGDFFASAMETNRIEKPKAKRRDKKSEQRRQQIGFDESDLRELWLLLHSPLFSLEFTFVSP